VLQQRIRAAQQLSSLFKLPTPVSTNLPLCNTVFEPYQGYDAYSYCHAPAERQRRGVIAFVSDRKGNQDIFIMNADGSDQRQLTKGISNDGWPSGRQTALRSSFIRSTQVEAASKPWMS